MSFHGSRMNRNAYKIPLTSTPLDVKPPSNSSPRLRVPTSGNDEFSPRGVFSSSSSLNIIPPQSSSSTGEPSSCDYIPSSLKSNFENQISLLLETNDKLNSQVDSMRANRGLHIDDEQFQIWDTKIKNMQAEVAEKVEENRSLREGVKVKQRRIEELEALLANSKLAKDEMMSMLERERREKEDILSARGADSDEKAAPIRPITKEAQSQTSHRGPIPPPALKPPLTTSTSTSTDVRVQLNAFTQTEAQPKRSSRPLPPTSTDADVDQMMIMSELDDIRRALETSGTAYSAPTAWSETCSHGVVACLSSVKQRATVFRRELDLLRRQVKTLKETQISERRVSIGKQFQQATNKKEQHSQIRRTSEIVVGPPPVKLLEIGNPGGSISPERVDRMSERLSGAGGSSSGSRFSMKGGNNNNNNNNNNNFPQLSNSPLAEVLRRQKDSDSGGNHMMSPIQTRDGGGSMRIIRRPSGQGGAKFQSFRRMSSNSNV
ncbi:hypothetical protein TrCOL_g4316 [Triparma columacea]|uniref:Uncharacterized protein n=1 Tax=Triparma columacea TaxID=722753 RepID=A0A9W7GNX2_9STRA|nr:hypothetical protein TrCOL_g4316 [Triparma columacea]